MPSAIETAAISGPHPSRNAASASFLGDYRALPGIYDELVDAEGRLRPRWAPFITALAGLGPTEIARRFAGADRHLRDSGVFYRVYGDPAESERAWPLSHIPLMLDAEEWRELKDGLVQRATLLEAILADAYGPGRFASQGILPASVIAGSPEFLRPLIGVTPPGGAHLRLYAADLGRGPDGSWWILNDRTQAPSGAGYALENRIALSRALPDVYQSLHVERLAGFFQAFRAELAARRRSDDSRVGILTPGPLNETYFEHAYLARYLGFLLVEGEDLAVRGNAVYVRTITGLKRVEVLWRRIDADFADPLELNARSRLGVPGLAQAVREGSVVLVNGLGAGLVEANALMGFIPALARHLLGGRLALPNVATWWCGQEREREFVLDRLEALVVAPAFTQALPGLLADGAVLGSDLGTAERARLVAAIRERGTDFVGQEAVQLSTMPVWRDGRLEPQPFILRLIAARTAEGWTVMPGGFCRISDRTDARAVTMQRGGRSADVWVSAGGPVAATTLLPLLERVTPRRQMGSLPSRAADNLFWLGRYVERAEATLRMVRAVLGRVAEFADANGPVVQRLVQVMVAWGTLPRRAARMSPAVIAAACLHGREARGALPRLIRSARGAAAAIRDRFSPDAWRALNDLLRLVETASPRVAPEAEAFERTVHALQIIAAFSGFAQENMNRFNGWRFLDIGRRIERAIATCRFARQLAEPGVPVEALDALLELADSQITFRLRYTMIAARALVLDLVALDTNNPRSIAFQVERIEEHLGRLPDIDGRGLLSPAQRIAVRLSTDLRTADPERLSIADLRAMEDALMHVSDEIALRYFTHRDRPQLVWESFA
ncbi:MAG: circularly permuted type 2 ATP-grasp protein [Methylobacteriaceae bacterium]|nr:circularly permuted type 2 ATP-grasp protein [Methylobacteriaceae bacterium]